MNLYDATVPVLTKFLKNMESWIDKAIAFADSKKADPELVLHARLAIDMYPFIRQIQSACDQAKFTVAKLTGKDAPSHPDTEKTLAELRARIQSVVDYLATFKPEDFVGAEERPCTHSWMGGKTLRGGDYLDHYALPNFHFHATVAYSLLRHVGVQLGKGDFVGSLPFKS